MLRVYYITRQLYYIGHVTSIVFHCFPGYEREIVMHKGRQNMPENNGGSRGSTAGRGHNEIGTGAEGGGCGRGYPLLQIGSKEPPKGF